MPNVQFVTPSDILGRTIADDAAAVWLLVDDDPISMLAAIEHLRLPILLTDLKETCVNKPLGALVYGRNIAIPPDADPIQVRAVVECTLGQACNIDELNQELGIATRLQKSLMSQVEQLDQEMQLAAKMQKLFLPRQLPKMPGITFDVLFQPSFYVSGDIYDVQQITEHDVTFFIADAVGHGAPAALMTMFIKQAMKLSETVNGKDQVISPDIILIRLNQELMSRDLDTFNFATVCIGTYNVQTRVLRMAHSIHPAPIRLKADDTIEQIELEGPMLGICDDEPFELKTLTLEKGDRLLIHSDGFELAFGNPQEPMNPQYIEHLHAMAKGTQAEAIKLLKTKLDRQMGSINQLDDLTVLMMDVLE
jgi:serine phosphatase RsbU (regulator of sigma subunit)